MRRAALPTVPRAAIAVAAAIAAAVTGGCTGSEAVVYGADTPPPIAAPRELGRFEDRDITESSGAALGGADGREVYWTLNDSGNDAELFAFDSAGRALGTLELEGVRNRDWEAIAVGPCPEGRCLYVGDVGDNDAKRKRVHVWRVPEPADPATAGTVRPTGHVAITWDGGPRDVEAMWLAADTSLWFATKRPIRDAAGRVRPSLVHRLDRDAWDRDTATLRVVDSLPIVPSSVPGQVVDAAFAVVGGAPRLAVVTYVAVHVFGAASDGRPGPRLAECSLAPFGVRQGEGVTWRPSGALLFTAESRRATIWEGVCP